MWRTGILLLIIIIKRYVKRYKRYVKSYTRKLYTYIFYMMCFTTVRFMRVMILNVINYNKHKSYP